MAAWLHTVVYIQLTIENWQYDYIQLMMWLYATDNITIYNSEYDVTYDWQYDYLHWQYDYLQWTIWLYTIDFIQLTMWPYMDVNG